MTASALRLVRDAVALLLGERLETDDERVDAFPVTVGDGVLVLRRSRGIGASGR